MYNKSKNKILFAVFIAIILLIVFILILSVYSTKENSNIEEYKISLNNTIYDKEYNYISLQKNSVLKKEWDENYYLYENNSSVKHELGTEPVFFDKTKKQITIFGNVFQVFSNGETIEKKGKTIINSLSDFQFFKLNDRKYLIINSLIKNENFSTNNYLMISIDKAGNATLLNDEVNIKTINPLILFAGDIKFDIANEKLIIKEEEIDLKKINGSSNEYVQKENIEQENTNQQDNNITNNNSDNNSNKDNSNSEIYNQIMNQIINISGLISNNTTNKTNLYKNISLRNVNVGASYLDINYSIIDPEDKYLSVFLAIEDEDEIVKFYYLNKDSVNYRISGLSPNKQYKLSINYIVQGDSSSVVADSVLVFTNSDPTSVRLIKINGTVLTYKVKMYNEYEFSSAVIALTNCEDSKLIDYTDLDVQAALSGSGDTGELELGSNYQYDYVCLSLNSVKDLNGKNIMINSYHKVKIK